MRAGRSVGVAIACAVSALLYAGGFPPYSLPLLAWFALVPLLIGLRETRTPSGAAGAGVFFAVLACALTIDWVPRTTAYYFEQSTLVGVLLFFGIALLMVAPWVAAFAVGYRFLVFPAPVRPWIAAALWIVAEWCRSSFLSGNPFVLFGYSQVPWLPVIQVAEWSGIYGISFILMLSNATIAEISLRRDSLARVSLIPIALLATAIAVGVLRLASERARSDVAEKSALVVQGNLDLGSRWRPELYGRNLHTYLQLTTEALRAAPADLILWPENAMTFFLAREDLYRAAIGHALPPGHLLIAGGPHVRGEQATERFFNAAFSIDHEGHIIDRYDKVQLLPFAEYFPGALDFLRRDFGRVREFTPGNRPRPIDTTLGPMGAMICNEAMFPAFASQLSRAGARVLIALSNDGWIDDPRFGQMALDMAIVRAVEQRRYVLRSSTSGPSAVIAPTGRQTALIESGRRGVERGHFALRDSLTPYARYGDWLVGVAGWAMAILCVAHGARRRRQLPILRSAQRTTEQRERKAGGGGPPPDSPR